jgi:hypothetical protein
MINRNSEVESEKIIYLYIELINRSLKLLNILI